MESFSPVALFVYNRPELTKKTIESLKDNINSQNTDLYIFSDAAKNIEQYEAVCAVREIINHVIGFRSVSIFLAATNRGLANSIIEGVSLVLEKHGKVIVLEDDIITSKVFLNFMNSALEYYVSESKIWSISGYKFPFPVPSNYSEAIFYSYRSSSWGWATWLDRWKTIDWDLNDYKIYKYNPLKIAKFCRGGTDLDKMLRYQMKGKIDSWAIRWNFNQFIQDKYTVYPIKSLVTNIGTDGSGTHCDIYSSRFQVEVNDDFHYTFNMDICINNEIKKRLKKTVDRSIIRKIKRLLHIK